MPVTQEQIDKSVEILRRYGATRVLLFGSAVDSPETARDLDLAVDGIGGWEFLGAAAEVSRALPIPFDLVPLSPASRFTQCIERRGRWLYEQ